MPALDKNISYDQKKAKLVKFQEANLFKEKKPKSKQNSPELDYLIKIYQQLQKMVISNDKILQDKRDNGYIMELEEENVKMKNKLKNSFPVHIICYLTICSAIMTSSVLLLVLRFVFGIYTIEPYYIICTLLISTTLFFTAMAAIKDWKDYVNGKR